MEIYVAKFIKGVEQRHLPMDRFLIELVANASAKFLPHNTLSCFTSFMANPLNLKRQWLVAIAEICSASMYQNVTVEKSLYF